MAKSPILLILISAIIGLSSSSIKNVCLRAHNKLRKLHKSTGPLKWDNDLAKEAQAWANKLASKRMFKHDESHSDGENLYFGTGPVERSCAEATLNWYNEYKLYNYRNPSVSSGVGHFTQVVWRSSKKLGVGIASYTKSKKVYTYVVARYSPAGNNRKRVSENVKRRKAGATVPTIYQLDPSLCNDGSGTTTCKNYEKWGFCKPSNKFYKFMDTHCAKTCKIC